MAKLKRFIVRLRRQEVVVYKAAVIIEADSESEAIDIAEETGDNVSKTWLLDHDHSNKWVREEFEVIEAEELDDDGETEDG